jgi:hypothetical protein
MMKLIFDFPESLKKAAKYDSYKQYVSHCSTCYGLGYVEKEVPVIDFINGGYIDVRNEPCLECGGDG